MGLPYDTFHSRDINLYVMSSHTRLRANNAQTQCTHANQCENDEIGGEWWRNIIHIHS